MKKYPFLLALLLIPWLCFAGSIQRMQSQVLGMYAAAGGASCDDCSGNLIYSHHCENNDDATAGTPCGCSDSVDYKSWTKTNAVYSDVQKHDGTYSIYTNGDNHNVALNNTGDWLDIEITGCWKGYVWIHTDSNTRLFTLGTTIVGYRLAADDKVYLAYGSEQLISSNTMTAGEFVYIECAWDASQSAGSDKLKIIVGATTTEQTNRTLTNQAASATNYIIGGSWQTSYGYFDQIELWSTYAGN